MYSIYPSFRLINYIETLLLGMNIDVVISPIITLLSLDSSIKHIEVLFTKVEEFSSSMDLIKRFHVLKFFHTF